DKIVRTADEVVTASSSIREYFGRGEVITNAAADETVALWKSGKKEPGSRFVVGVLGTINHLCPIDPLFKTLACLLKTEPELRNTIRIMHVGHCDADMVRAQASLYELGDLIDLKGYLERKTAIRTLVQADLLYLSVHRFEEYNILPGRIFDYLVSGKPVLGIIPADSDAATLIGEYSQGAAFRHDEIEKAAAYIKRMFEKRSAIGNAGGIHDPGLIASAMADQYALVLNRLQDGEP
ncbi:MAG: hypothetical protein JSV44_03935, partial [Candidatus Zixiibacteriota bacterium]